MADGAGGKEVGRISIRVVPNTDRFRADLQRQLSAIEKEVRATVHVDADLDESGVKAKFRALMAELKAQGARGVNVKVDVDSNSLQRGLSGLGSGAGGAAGGLGGMGHGLAIVAAVAAFAAPALALLSGALASLPALLSAVLIPVGAVALGLDGLKKAAEVLTEPLASLKATMSQRFQDVFTPILTKLTGIFPTLEQSLPGVADGLGAVAESLVSTITSQAGLDRIKSTISNIASAIATSAPGVGLLTNGLLGLASGVTAKFPAVSDWINKVGESFDNWVTKANSSGQLDRAMDNFGTTLKGVLDIVGDLAKAGFDFLQDPNFGKSMTDFVSSIKSLVNDILPGLKTFFMDLSNGLKTVTDTINQVQNLKKPEWLDSLLSSPTAEQTKGKDTSNIFEPFTSPDAGWRGMVDGLKTGWDATISWMKTTWTQFTGFFTQQGNIIATAWSQNWETVKSAALAAWNFIATNAQSVWASISSTAQGALSGIGNIFSNIPNQLRAAWASLGGVASSAWSAVVSAVQQAFGQAVAAVVTGAAQIVSEAAAIPGKVAAAIGSLAGVLVAAGKSLMDGLLSGIKAGLSAVLDFASGIAAKIAAVKGPLPKDRTTLTPNGQALMQGLQDGIEGGFEGVLNRARQLAGEISAAINGSEPIDASGLTEKLKRQMDEIGLERDALKNQVNATDDKDKKKSLKDQMAELQTLRDQLKEQKDQLGFSEKYGQSVEKTDNVLGESLSKMVTATAGFATANAKQFASDLGISGTGALSQAADQGLSFLTSTLSGLVSKGFGGGTTIHVGSIEEALTAKQNIANKQSLQYRQR